MKNLIGTAAPTKKIDFLGQKNSVTIRKLNGREMKDFQAHIKTLQSLPEEEQGLQVQYSVIRLGVLDAAELTDDELDTFPTADVVELAKEVLVYSGMNMEAPAKGND